MAIALTQYKYSIQNDFPNRRVAPDRLTLEIQQSVIVTALDHIDTIGDVCEFAYGKGLKADERQSGSIPVYGSNGQVGWHDEALVGGPGVVIGRKGNPGTVVWSQTDFFPIDTCQGPRHRELL